MISVRRVMSGQGNGSSEKPNDLNGLYWIQRPLMTSNDLKSFMSDLCKLTLWTKCELSVQCVQVHILKNGCNQLKFLHCDIKNWKLKKIPISYDNASDFHNSRNCLFTKLIESHVKCNFISFKVRHFCCKVEHNFLTSIECWNPSGIFQPLW